MKVFVSGIGGLIGSHIAREGQALGWEITGADNMMSDSAVASIPREVRWVTADVGAARGYEQVLRGAEVVYHCAAAPYEGLSVFSPVMVAEHTFMSTVGLLKASINAGVRRFVYCSSMSRYGHQKPPFTEGMAPWPADPYAVCKVAAEGMVQNLCELHGMEYVIAVPHNVYGPGQRYWDPYRNVAGIMLNRVLQGKPPVVYGDGTQRRCMSYISDVTGPMLRMATEPVAGDIFNVGPGDEGITMNELAALVLEVTGSSLKPVYFPDRPGEVRNAWCSDEKLRRELGYQPQVTLKEGLGRYAEWIEEQGPRPFVYHLPVEILSEKVPATWSARLM